MEAKDLYDGMLKRLDKVPMRGRERVAAEMQMRRAAAIVEAVLGMFEKGTEPQAPSVRTKH